MHSIQSHSYRRVLNTPPQLPTEQVIEKKITDNDFLNEKKKEDNYADQLLIQLVPIIRTFSFLPKKVIQSCFGRVIEYIYSNKNQEAQKK